MLLVGEGGASVDLRVAGYQFPALGPESGGDDWDANWLVIAGRVRAAAGRTWSFRDPGLTTWEVAEVADWLDRAARGAVPAVAPRLHAGDPEDDDASAAGAGGDEDGPSGREELDELDEHGWQVFTEPCLSLGVARAASEAGAPGGAEPAAVPGDTSDELTLLVGLRAEWAPPSFPDQAYDCTCVELRLHPGQLARAAAELREELARFPRR